jgi:2-desacetyl-2-hydroxyethyl bacteriochlorophyllide A dehydrogenase
MKRLVCNEPGSFSVQHVDQPRPASGEALLKIHRAGVCGTDLHAFGGNQPYFEYPRVLGHELAAEVVAFGSSVRSDIAVGDRVVVVPYLECGTCIACRRGRTNCCTSLSVIGVHVDGGMQEYITHPVSHLVKADGLSWEQIALVECLCIGAHAVGRAGIEPGQHVVVVGAGPIGIGVMQFAMEAGGSVIAVDIDEARLSFCTDHIGVRAAVNAADDPVRRVKELTDGDFAPVVLDATGSPKAMAASLAYVAHSGTLVYVGVVKADIPISDPEFHKRETTLLSSRNATPADFAHVIESLRTGSVSVDGCVTHTARVDEVPQVFESWTKPGSRVIKAMVSL